MTRTGPGSFVVVAVCIVSVDGSAVAEPSLVLTVEWAEEGTAAEAVEVTVAVSLFVERDSGPDTASLFGSVDMVCSLTTPAPLADDVGKMEVKGEVVEIETW